MRIFVFGNPDLKIDSLPVKLLPRLREEFPEHEFIFQDPNEEWDMSEPFWVIDTVVGLKEPRVFDSLDAFVTQPNLSMHDFDALSNLRFLKKLGKLPKIKIIGLPVGVSEDKTVETLVKLLCYSGYMKLFFITGNQNKFEEARSVFPELEQLKMDLVEIQETDARVIIEHKLQEALRHHKGSFIVEDTSLYLEALGGLPGPLIKWFMQSLGNDGLYRLAEKLGNTKAIARTWVGFADKSEGIHFFEGETSGNVVYPRGNTSFGWDPIFMPDGFNVTFAEMTKDQKNAISMRKQALEKLKAFLVTQTT